MESGKPIWDHNLGVNIFKLLMRIRRDELEKIPEDLCKEGKYFLGKSSFGGSPSPRGNFDFPDWVSMAVLSLIISHGGYVLIFVEVATTLLGVWWCLCLWLALALRQFWALTLCQFEFYF
ncbi:hypothetical protein L3X38_031601 [Prunus dulcis]|uniref:Uncharacterized protein n=1 Tax=Prunus dulcis TaxID=3755 RepID=A0AAD4VCE8_PRUDU|nr:hypothetical protein L3X38_031601 [Prunus dulcis]